MSKKQHPNSLANLRPPIRPGQQRIPMEVRNPLGINRKRPITDEYWQASQETMPVALIYRFNKRCGIRLLKPGDTWARGVAVRCCYEAVIEASERAAKEVREAIEGKAPQRLEVHDPERKEVRIVVRYDRRSAREAMDNLPFTSCRKAQLED